MKNSTIFKFVISLTALLFLQCKSIQLDKKKTVLMSKSSTLIIDGDNFEYKENGPIYFETTMGSVKKEDNYFLTTFDSIVSEELYFKSTEYTKENIPKDSILFTIKAPLNKHKVDNKYCENFPYIIEVSESFNKPIYFEKSSFKNVKSGLYTIIIYPKTLCNYSISMHPLFFSLFIYKEDTNYVEIELPDLDENRFSYLNFKNCELKKVGANKYILFHNDEKEVFEIK